MRTRWVVLILWLVTSCRPSNEKNTYVLHLQINDSLHIPFILTENQGEYSIVNGSENIALYSSVTSDSIQLEHPVFNSFLVFKKSGDSLRGYWYNKEKGSYSMPFTGTTAKHLFTKTNSSSTLASKYAVHFSEDEDQYPAVGMFESNNGNVSGTFLTETGDYRYLNGVISGDSLKLATFDMAHAFLFTGLIKDQWINGTFYSGKHYQTNWQATANSNAELRDATSIIELVDSVEVDFRVVGLSKEEIDIDHALFKNKAVVIQLFGSWCPNCYDESIFLNSLYSKYKEDVAFMGVAFERSKTFEEALNKINKFRSGLSIQYPLTYGGAASKDTAQKVFPFLQKVESFPTLLFFDRDHNIISVHSGFSGPGTGDEYEKSKKLIQKEIEKITQE